MFSKAKVSLQNVEDKLRRYFGLAGEIGSSFEPTITPALMVGTLDDPGVASFRGRHWMYGGDQISAPVSPVLCLQFAVPVIVRQISASHLPANVEIGVYIFSPDETPFGAQSRNVGTWVDQRTVGSERVPITDSGFNPVAKAPGSPAYGITNRILTFGATAASQIFVYPCAIHVPAGGGISFDLPTGATLALAHFGLRGQIF